VALPPFHLAIPVGDLAAARAFYGDLLGCPEGRSDPTWVDFDFRGHQLVVHLAPDAGPTASNAVDGHGVPVPHFGLVVPWEEWPVLRDRLTARGVPFLVPPHVRFRGGPGEQATFFVADPSGNAIEFKAFRDPGALFRVS
jgi:extradiol dioxygenase family protein